MVYIFISVYCNSYVSVFVKTEIQYITGHNTKCSHNVCANRGVCVQQWNSYTCDCDMTSYTGPTCSDGNFFTVK